MGALVVLAAQAGSIEPGAEAESVVLVRNTGEATGEFLVTVRGTAAPWAVVEPRVLRLEPGEEAPAWVRFRPPRAPTTTPGTAPFTVAVVSRHEPDLEVVEQGAVDVGTFSALSAELTAPPTAGARWNEFVVAVRNLGNRSVLVSMDVEAAQRQIEVEVEPAEVRLAAGAIVDVSVRVRPRRRLLPQRGSDREVTIAAVSDGGALATVRTALSDDSSLASELQRSARVLVVLLVLLVLGGLALLRSENSGRTVDVTQGDQPVPLPTAPPASTEPAPAAEPEAPAGPAEPAVVAEPSSAAAAPAPPLPKLAFIRIYGPNSRDIVVREAGDSHAELRLRTDTARESRPRLSPGGSHIAFVQEQNGLWQVCVTRSGGGGSVCQRQATAGSVVDWSPDGRTLYYSRASELYSASFDPAAGQLGVERDLGLTVPNSYFALSPDGTRIVFAEGEQLVVRPLSGSGGIRVTVRGAPDDPSWSPDGKRIVYTSQFQLFIAPVGDGPIRKVTRDGTVNGDPAWSRDGWIVFRSNRSGTGDLYAVRADGGEGQEVELAVLGETAEREVTPSF